MDIYIEFSLRVLDKEKEYYIKKDDFVELETTFGKKVKGKVSFIGINYTAYENSMMIEITSEDCKMAIKLENIKSISRYAPNMTIFQNKMANN